MVATVQAWGAQGAAVQHRSGRHRHHAEPRFQGLLRPCERAKGTTTTWSRT